MASGIEINDDLIAGLVPVLKDPATFESFHSTAKENDSLLHLTHTAMMASAIKRANYNETILHAIETGVKAYETLGATVGEPIPAAFALQIIANRERNPNFGLMFGEELREQRGILIDKYPILAQGLYELCLAQIKDPQLASIYGLGGAAVIRAAHEEIYNMWQFERDYNS